MIGRLWRANRLLFLGFVATTLLALFFAVRTAMFLIYWADPMHQFQPVAPWMTPRYVAMSWHVPPEIVFDALDFDRDATRGRITLAEIAAARSVDFNMLAAELETALENHEPRQ